MRIHGVIVAAGMSSRFKGFKPLVRIGGRTMIETVVSTMAKGGVDEITIVLGHQGEAIEAELKEKCPHIDRIRFVYNEAYATTQMLESVKCGVMQMNECDYFFITPVDMPAIAAETYRDLSKRADGDAKVIFATYQGYRKHPPLVSWKVREDILSFEGEGLRKLWTEFEGEILEVPLDDKGCTMDVDYFEDYIKVCENITGVCPL